MTTFTREIAELQYKKLRRWKSRIESEARALGVDPWLIAAIISRETAVSDRYCLPPQEGGKLGDAGFGHGPMQIDKRSFPDWCAQWRAGSLSTGDGIAMGCQVLKQKMRSISRLIPEMPESERLRAAIAAYNCGEGNVRRHYRAKQDIDKSTAHGTYSKDVLARAELFKQLWQ